MLRIIELTPDEHRRIRRDLRVEHSLVYRLTDAAVVPERVLYRRQGSHIIVQGGALKCQAMEWPGHLLHDGQRVRVRLRAAPSVSKKTARGQRGRRTALEGGDALAWVRERLGEALDIERADIAQQRTMSGSRGLTFFAVDFEIVGVIKDIAALARLQEEGIGSGKAYGMGLLLVMPT